MSVLESKIHRIEAQLRSKLDETRDSFKHSGVKGDVLEASFREMLMQFLPRSTGIGHGEVIDTMDGRSAQTDVVVVSGDHPFTFEPEVAGLFFIEGVLAAGEVKTNLEGVGLKRALANSKSFRNLRMHPGAGRVTPGNTDENRYYVSPPWFLFALESRLSLDKIQIEIEKFIGGSGWVVNQAIDAVFVLSRGWLVNLGEGNGLYRLRGSSGELIQGWHQKASDTVLFDFLAWLSSVMPRIHWDSPILPRYLTEMYFRV